MSNTDGAKKWRITLPGNRKVVVGGSKTLITEAGALVVVGNDGRPSHMWRSWHEVVELHGDQTEVER